MEKKMRSKKGLKIRTRSNTSISSKPLKCLVEKDLVPYIFFYFSLYGAYGSLLPYLPLYFKQLGIRAFEAGVIIGIRPMVQIIGAPFFGALADRYLAGKLLLFLGVLGWILKALIVMAVRPHNQQCISIYHNVNKNATFTYIYAVPLWGDDKREWTLVPLHIPFVIKKQTLSVIRTSSKNKGNSTEEKPSKPEILSKHKNEETFSFETKKLHLIKRKIYRNTKDAFPCFRDTEKLLLNKRANAGKRFDYLAGQQNTQQIIKRRLTGFQNATPTIRPKATQVTYIKEDLDKIGKSISHIVRGFNTKINTTVMYITQIDNGEIQFVFVILSLLIIFGEFLESPTYTLSDASLLDRLGEDREYYGNIRMFGSLGWALASLLVGYLVAATELVLCEVPSGNYLVSFYIFMGCCAVALFCVFGFTFKYDNKKQSLPSCREFGQLLLNLRFSNFLVSALFVGWCYGFLIHFVNWFIDDLHGSSLIMGVAGAARELTGLLFFFIGGSVISVLGHVNTMVLCLLAYMVLFSCYSVVINPWFVVALEMMAGANFALAWSTCVNYTNRVGSALGVTSTVQGLLQSVFWGLGNGGGSVFSGALYYKYGPIVTFQVFAVGAITTLLFVVSMNKIAESYNIQDLALDENEPITEQYIEGSDNNSDLESIGSVTRKDTINSTER